MSGVSFTIDKLKANHGEAMNPIVVTKDGASEELELIKTNLSRLEECVRLSRKPTASVGRGLLHMILMCRETILKLISQLQAKLGHDGAGSSNPSNGGKNGV